MAFALPAPRQSKNALGFLFITVLLDLIGIGIIIPVMPELLATLTGLSNSEVTIRGGYLLFVYAVMQFFMSPILGGISDRFGRRPVLLLSLLGYAFDFLLMAVAPTYWWLFLGRALAGAFAATHATANAYIADITPPEKRAANYGLLGAAFGIGFILGPIIGGILGEHNVRYPFFAASALAFLNVTYGFFFLPESLAVEKRRKFDLKRANPLGSFRQVAKHPIVLGVIFTFMLMQLAHNAFPSIWSYFAVEKFGWSPAPISWSLAFVGLVAAFTQGFLVRLMIPKLGERKAVWLGMSVSIIQFLGIAFYSPSGFWVYFWILMGAFGGFMMPAMQGLMSRATPPNAQGELQGAIASSMSITMLISPLFMTGIFRHFTKEGGDIYFPGAPFFAGAILLSLAAIVFAITLSKVELQPKDSQADKSEPAKEPEPVSDRSE
ncbi:MAG: TCR/Tet family MFS transporter [bacterium]